MRFLVTEIDINYGKPLVTTLPIIYSEDYHLPVVYLRTEVFHQCRIKYLVEDISKYVGDDGGLHYETGHNVQQPLNADVADQRYENVVNIVADMLHPRSMVVHVEEDEYQRIRKDYVTSEEANEYAVFEALMTYMPIDFFIRTRK